MIEPVNLWKGQRGEEHPAPPVEEPMPTFVPGDVVQTTLAPVYVRALPDKTSALVVKLETFPVPGSIIDGPITSQYVYYQFSCEYQGVLRHGWVDEQRLTKVVPVLTARQRAEAFLVNLGMDAEAAGSL